MKNSLRLAYAVAVITIVTSCTEQVDFEQAKDLGVQPVLTVSLATFTANALQYALPGVIQNQSITDTLGIFIVESNVFQNDVIKAELAFNIENSVAADFNLSFSLTDEDFVEQYQFDIPIPEGNLTNPIIVDYIEVFEGAALDQLDASRNIILTATIINSSENSFNTGDMSEFTLKSKATAFFDFDL